MRPTDVISAFAPGFIASGIEWMVVGGVAAIVYGEPRLTQDLDVVAAMDPSQAAGLAAQFVEPRYYCPPVEVIANEAARESHGLFNLLHLASDARADVYLAGRDALSRRGLVTRRTIALSGLSVPLAPPEYVIQHKLQFRQQGASERHLRDVRAMLRVLGDTVNVEELQAEADVLGLSAQWIEMYALDE